MTPGPTSKVKVGFFSFTEITDPSEHHSYNAWHMLDHMPEQYPLPGIVYGQRWVSTPACRAARTVSNERLDPIHYMTLYLMSDPVDETIAEFMQLGKDLHAKDRFHLHRKARLSGPFALEVIEVAERVLISPEAVPYRPNKGIHVVVQTVDRPGPPLGEWCATPGVAGAWTFADDTHRISVAWLDDEPLAVTLPPTHDAGIVFAGPLEAITPWQWDWFD
jgi:hypothetical protein